MIALLGAVVLLVAASVLLGRAVQAAVGSPDRATGPVVGFAGLVILSDFVLQIGGRGWEAALLIGAVIALATLRSARPGGGRPSRVPIGAAAAAAAALAGGLLPFWANHRAGTLGVGIENDLAIHQYWAWALQVGAVFPGLIDSGYPLGAHSLAAALASAGATNTERSLAALLAGVPVLTALTAHALLDHLRAPLRAAASALVALPYLGAAFLAEGSFKEPMVALLLLGCAAELRSLGAIDPAAQPPSAIARRAVALGILVAACVLIEGKPGLAWPGATVVTWLLLRLARTHRPLGLRRLASRLWPAAAAAAGVALVSVAAELGRIAAFSPNLGGSNLPYPLPIAEAAGVWVDQDFRLAHTSLLGSRSLTVMAGLLLLYAVVWHLRRRREALVAALVAAAAVYLYVRSQGSPYLSAKALMILSPLFMATVLGALLSPSLPPTGRAGPSRVAAAALGGVVALAFTLTAAYSSTLALRGAVVNPDARSDELAPLRGLARGQDVLLLLPDDFAAWKLRGTRASFVTEYGIRPRVEVAVSPVAAGLTLTFDTVNAGALDRLRYVVTSRSPFAPTPPPNWRVAMTTPSYRVWTRVGPTPTIRPFSPADPAGARLDCHLAATRSLVARTRLADVRAPSVIGPATSWRLPGGGLVALSPAGFVAVPTGATVVQRIVLPPGEWDISLPYQAAVDLQVSAGSLNATLPANLDTFGPYWSAGRTRGGGPLVVSVRLDPRRFPARPLTEAVGPIAATRVDLPPRLVHAAAACGQVVDWLEN